MASGCASSTAATASSGTASTRRRARSRSACCAGRGAPDAAWLRAPSPRRPPSARPLVPARPASASSTARATASRRCVVDRFGDTLVVASYSTGADVLARYVAHAARDSARERPAAARASPPRPRAAARMRARSTAAVARFSEDGLAFAVDLAAGHKTGAYLDLRGLRHAVAASALAGARVLNLFAVHRHARPCRRGRGRGGDRAGRCVRARARVRGRASRRRCCAAPLRHRRRLRVAARARRATSCSIS